MEKKQLWEDKIFTVDNFLSENECKAWITRAESKGFNQSAPSGGGHGRTGREDPRTSQFIVFAEQTDFAKQYFDRVIPFVPEGLSHLTKTAYITSAADARLWKCVGVNPRLRIYKYEKGQAFPEHIDYKMQRTVWRGGEKYRQQTFITLLIYLNEAFSEGQTGYWTQHDVQGKKEHCRFLRDVENKPHQVLVEPVAGRALLSDSNILHEGVAPGKGVKYVLRTDLVHEKHMPLHPKVAATMSAHDRRDREDPWQRQFESSCKNYAD